LRNGQFVLPDGTTGATVTFTVGTEPVQVVLHNPTVPTTPTTPTTPPTTPTTPTTPPLPNTGVDVIGTSVTALVLLFLGGVLVLLGTRRRWDKR
jgi:LPXTG-motif cell wall-anchored protein